MGIMEYDLRPVCQECRGKGGTVDSVGGVYIRTNICKFCKGEGKLPMSTMKSLELKAFQEEMETTSMCNKENI